MRHKRAAMVAGLMVTSFLAGALAVFNYGWRWLHRPKER